MDQLACSVPRHDPNHRLTGEEVLLRAALQHNRTVLVTPQGRGQSPKVQTRLRRDSTMAGGPCAGDARGPDLLGSAGAGVGRRKCAVLAVELP